MQSKLFKKAKLNAFAAYVNFVINSILVFILSPYLVQFLGSYNFGIWKSIQKILSFATIADGRSTQALKWIIANDEGKENYDEKQQAVGSALKVWFYFLPLMLLIIFLIVYNLPLMINNLNKNFYDEIYLVGTILGINIVINPLFGIPDAILIGTNNGYKSTNIQTIGVVFTNLLMLLTSYFGYGLIGLGYVTVFVTFLNAFFVFIICKKNVRWMGIQKPHKTQVKSFFNFSFWVLIWSFIERLMLSTELILISYLINPETVSKYVFSTYIVQLSVAVALLSGSAVTPGLGKLIGEKNIESAKRITLGIREVIIAISAFFGGLILLFNKSFVSLWMGETYFLGTDANLILVLLMIQLVMIRLEGQIQDLSLNIKNKVIYGGVISFFSVALAILGYRLLGNKIEGLFLGILVGRFLQLIIFKNMVNKIVNTAFIFTIKPYLFIGALFYISTYFPIIQNWWYFTVLFLGVAIFLLILVYLFLLSKINKNKVKEMLNTFIKKRRA